MSKIKPVTMYPCPETGNLFKSAAQANANARRVRKEKEAEAAETLRVEEIRANRQAIADSFRNELDDMGNFAALFKAKVLALTGIDLQINLRVRFGHQSCSHSSPIGKPTNWCGRDKNLPQDYLGWYGTVSGKIISPTIIKKQEVTLSSLLSDGWGSHRWRPEFGGFTGIYTGSGSFGTEFQGSINLWLDDYPIIKAKYDEFVKLDAMHRTWVAAQANARQRAEGIALALPDITTIDASISQLEKAIQNLRQERSEKFALLTKRNLVEIAPGFNVKDLEAIKGNFQ